MTIQVQDLMIPFSSLSHADKVTYVEGLRRSRNTRKFHKKKASTASAKTAKQRKPKIESLLANMSESEKEAFITLLTRENQP